MTNSETTTRPGPLPQNVKLLGHVSLLNDMASEMIYPLLPQFLINVLGGNRFHLGIIEGVGETVSSLLKLQAGKWSDRIGKRKPLVVAGYLLATFARPCIGLVVWPWQLFVARVGDRIGKGIRTAPRDALIADSTPAGQQGRAFGFHRAMDHLGAAIGPLIAAAWLWFFPNQLRPLFLLALIPGLAVLVLLVFRLKEHGLGDSDNVSEAKGSANEISKAEWSTAQSLNPGFRIYLLALAIFTLGNSSDAFLLVRAGELGISTAALPLLWFAFHIAKSVGNLISGRLVDRIGSRTPIIVGWIVYSLIYLGFGFATTVWHGWALFLGYAIFYSMTEPAEKAMVVKLVGRERKGLAFGWFNFAIGICALPSSLIFGALYESFGPAIAFGSGAGLALLAVLVLLTVRVDGASV